MQVNVVLRGMLQGDIATCRYPAAPMNVGGRQVVLL